MLQGFSASEIQRFVVLQITGGHKYLPPRQDINAPDLYIPFMAVCTFCLLACVSKLTHGSFTPESMYAVVCSLSLPWHRPIAVTVLSTQSVQGL